MRPLVELFSSGGAVMFFIAAVSVAAWCLTLRTWVAAGSLLKRFHKINVPLLQTPPSWRNMARSGRRLSTGPADFCDYRLFCFSAESQAGRLKRTLSLVGTLAAVLPLLGLLGTVLGMLISFEVIHVHGTSQPRLLAGGIGQALMTTQAGLWTALPVLFFHHIIRSRVRLIGNEIEVLWHVIQTRFANGDADGQTPAAEVPRPTTSQVIHRGGQ